MDILEYYTLQSPYTDPGAYGELYRDVPGDAAGICGVIDGLLLDFEERYKYPIQNERLLDTTCRYADKILERLAQISKMPLTEARAMEDRFMASASDFSLLCTSMLRAKGIPARKRMGFVPKGKYLVNCEVVQYWDGSSWKTADPSGKAAGGFLPAAKAWKDCREGKADVAQFRNMEKFGLEPVLSDLMHDLAALNKKELISWDVFGWMLRPFEEFSDRAWEILDTVAEKLLDDDSALEEILALYGSEEGLQVPKTITCESPIVPPHKIELR